MTLSRRGVLLGLAATALPAAAQPLRRVLFVGNSFLHGYDVPARVAALAAREGRPIEPHSILRPGARLSGHLRRRTVTETIGWGWEAVVLQDHSLEALIPERAAGSAAAVRRVAALIGGTPLVLVVPWARAEGHRLYRQAGMPGDPAEMTDIETMHYAALAAETGGHIAPVASAWQGGIVAGRVLHGPDGYHANAEGAALTAEVIWRTLARVLD